MVLLLLGFMFSSSVMVNGCFGCKYLFTLITRITEHVGEMLRLHMVPCAVPALVRKFTAQGAVVL